MRWIQASSEHVGCLARFQEFESQSGWEYGVLQRVHNSRSGRTYFVGQPSPAHPEHLRSYEVCEVQEIVSADLREDRTLQGWAVLIDAANEAAKASWLPIVQKAPTLGCDLMTACALIEAGSNTLVRLHLQLEHLGYFARQEGEDLGDCVQQLSADASVPEPQLGPTELQIEP